MYVGRLLVVAPGLAAYRVSSRSFPNRRAYARGADTVAVGPTEDAPETDNPYVAYNCLRVVDGPGGRAAVAGNGSHVDPIAEKIERGYPARDALALALLALDFEKDDYDTPRIAGVVDDGGEGSAAYAAIVRRDALLVEPVTAPTLVATYERDRPGTIEFAAEGAGAAARAAYDLEFEHPVCAAAASAVDGGDGGFDLAQYNGPGE
jgi:IMP cyclohydrolase